MKSLVWASIITATLVSCSSTKNNPMNEGANVLSRTDQNEGWQLLFDGKTTNGWHSYGHTTAGGAWKVEDSALVFDPAAKSSGQVGGDLVTNEAFEDFHFMTDWKVTPKGNSGIIFYVQDDKSTYGETWHTGMEMQVLDNAGHPDAQIFKHRAGDLYDLIPSSKDAVKPAGEWNQAEIISQDGKLELYLNNVKVVSTTLWDDAWKTLLAGSKFKDMTSFGTFKKGHIALQDHGDKVWFRNLKIKRL